MSDLEDAEQSVDPPRAVLQAKVERPKPSEVPLEQRHPYSEAAAHSD